MGILRSKLCSISTQIPMGILIPTTALPIQFFSCVCQIYLSYVKSAGQNLMRLLIDGKETDFKRSPQTSMGFGYAGSIVSCNSEKGIHKTHILVSVTFCK